jgi:ClpP class serine protease
MFILVVKLLLQVAQGRVWTGQQARERGLVDHIGGLWKALDVAVALLPPEERKPFAQAYRIDKVQEDTIFGIPKRALVPSMGTTKSTPTSVATVMAKSMEPMAICSDEGFYSGLIGTSADYVQSEIGKALMSFGLSPQFVLSMEGTGVFKSFERIAQSIAVMRSSN